MDATEAQALDVAASAWESCHDRNWAASDQGAVRRLAARAAIYAYEKETGERKALADALTLLVDNGSWYVRCLRDVIAETPVRGLPEAEAGYESALRKAALLS